MSATAMLLDAGGLLPPKSKVDLNATEQVVARTYRHPALGERPVVRLASDRLGQAEDLAMEFLGFEPPQVTQPIAVQQRRSLGFAAWALINDPDNAHFALELVKRMKGADRKAKSKPGHAWDAFVEMAQELGRSAPHFLPPFWEEAGRTFKELGNPTYAGRALNKSLEAERVHALESDRARRRDVVLEFVLSGCLAGKALSDYSGDLQSQYPADEAYAIFRDLCVRRTRGGMAPWATLPKDFAKIAKGAGLDGDEELERWLEEVIESPAMGRAANQFWKNCGKHCQRIVQRNPDFAVALLRHTRPADRYYGDSKLGAWLDLLDEWGVFPYLWEDEHQGAAPLGEPIADWFGRILRDEVPIKTRQLEMLRQLAPRLRKEKQPVSFANQRRYGSSDVDIDVLEACLALGVTIEDPPEQFSVVFQGWLMEEPDHPLRNQDIVEACRDERFQTAIRHGLDEALTCRGLPNQRGYRQALIKPRPFPLAAGDRPGITALWRRHTEQLVGELEGCGLASFETAMDRLEKTFWPDTLRLFPDLAERIQAIAPAAMLQRTLQAGSIDEYGWPELEAAMEAIQARLSTGRYGDTNLHLTFPHLVVIDSVYAHVIDCLSGATRKLELRLPKNCEVVTATLVGDDVAVVFRNAKWEWHFCWLSDPTQVHPSGYTFRHDTRRSSTVLANGGVFLGGKVAHPGDKTPPTSEPYLHDGDRFWRTISHFNGDEWLLKLWEIDPETGKAIRESLPAWFEQADGGKVQSELSALMPAPAGLTESPLGEQAGMLGWKVIRRRDGSYYGEGIDGRRWDKPLYDASGAAAPPIGLLRQPGTNNLLPISIAGSGRSGTYWLWDPTGATMVARLRDFQSDYAAGQLALLPIDYWHLLRPRHEDSSKKLRDVSQSQCQALLDAAEADRQLHTSQPARRDGSRDPSPLAKVLAALRQFLPDAPDRLVEGIARVVEHAEARGAQFTSLRAQAVMEATAEVPASALATHHRIDSGAAFWRLQPVQIYDDVHISVGANLAEAAQFLKGESAAGRLTRTNFNWFPLLEAGLLHCWNVFWHVSAAKLSQPGELDLPWLDFIEHWRQQGLADLPGKFALMEGVPTGVKKNAYGWFDIAIESGESFTLEQGKDRFIAIGHGRHGEMPYTILRYSTAAKPGKPAGYTVADIRELDALADNQQLAEFIAAAQSCDAPPLPTSEELAEVASRLNVTPVEVGLIWMAGLNIWSYERNFLPAELRKILGWKVTEADAGRQALRNLPSDLLVPLCQSVIAEGIASPFNEDRGPALRSMEKCWQSIIPKRLSLDASLQKRLASLGKSSRWNPVGHEQLLSAAADPAQHPALQPREISIQVTKSRNYVNLELAPTRQKDEPLTLEFFQSIVRLVALLHGETPQGHAARQEMPALIKQATRLLNSPLTMLPLREFHVYSAADQPTITASKWLQQHLGKTKADEKEGVERYDDGLLAAATDGDRRATIGFRPARLKDASDLTRLRGLLGADIGNNYGHEHYEAIDLAVVIRSPGFQKLAKAMVSRGVPQGEWPQNPLHSAPAVVEAIAAKQKLGEDAAMLYAQLLALPDPTTAHLRAWNGWTAARLKQAGAELVKKKLVLEAKRARAGRTLFLPGEWSDLKSPALPIETWKLSHLLELDFPVTHLCPVGYPTVLRPFAELFASAWQRVTDGDPPRYEEVKRKRKRK